MSTEHYQLAEPFKSVRVEHAGDWDCISLWDSDGYAGTLSLKRDDTPLFLRSLSGEGDPVACTYYGGSKRGLVVVIRRNDLPDSTPIIGAGEVLTLGELKRRAGASQGRKGEGNDGRTAGQRR